MDAQQQRRLARQIVHVLLSRSTAAFVAGIALASLIRRAHAVWQRVRQARAEFLWRRHVDFGVVQACVLSTEHLQALGRVEKRTLFVKPIAEVFRNEYILARVLEAAEKAVASKNPMLMTQLSPEDKWHVLNTCTNHISSCFAPYHVFFNEARRAKSYYKSAWYCFTLTCAQTEACGRWFITPLKPVGPGDCGSLRIRMVLMNEQELREIASGNVEEPAAGMFNGRHESRWQVCQRFAELFARQLRRVTGSKDFQEDWGKNLCGRLQKRKEGGAGAGAGAGLRVSSHVRLAGLQDQIAVPEYEPEDNSILRIHIPFPSTALAVEAEEQGENVSKDVVLFE